jgi:hypothetical protein
VIRKNNATAGGPTNKSAPGRELIPKGYFKILALAPMPAGQIATILCRGGVDAGNQRASTSW